MATDRHFLSVGLDVAGESYRLLRRERSLLLFPAVALVTTVVITAVFLQSLATVGATVTRAVASVVDASPITLVLLAFYCLVGAWLAGVAAVITFCNAGLVHCTAQVVEGEEPSVASGFAAAVRTLPQVLVFAGLVGAIGTAVALAERRSALLRKALAVVAGGSFAVLSFFVLPAAVLDGHGPASMFRRSVELVGERFSETATITLGVVPAVGTAFSLPVILLQVPIVVDALLGLHVFRSLLQDNVFVLGGIPALLMWTGVVAGTSLAAVAKAVLYVSARDDHDEVPLLRRRFEESVTVQSVD